MPIDEHSFFPIETKDELIDVNKACADLSKDFFEAYCGSNIIFLHRDALYTNNVVLRHHGIYIDLLPMLAIDRFQQKLDTKLKELAALPSCIIFPPHEAGEAFAGLIAKKLSVKFGAEPKQFCFAGFDVMTKTQKDEVEQFLGGLGESDTIMVVDDVSISGSRLHTYQKKYTSQIQGENFLPGGSCAT